MKQVCICLLALMIAACGWHLRGSVALPSTIDQLYLSADDPYTPLVGELRQRLTASGIDLTPGPIGAPYTLTITEQNQDSRVVGVGADSLASAYEVTLEVRYDISRSVGEVLAQDLSTSVTRSYEADAATAGSAAQERALVLVEMQRDLAAQILRRLQAEINTAEAQSETLLLDGE